MIAKALYHITAGLPCRLIQRNANERYLERYYLFRLPLGPLSIYFYLHRFVNADGDEELHDHPWWRAWALVLTGGYWEWRGLVRHVFHDLSKPRYDFMVEMGKEYRRVGRFTFNRLKGEDFHQIHSIDRETWTLFFHTEWKRQWGFAEEQPCLQWRDDDDGTEWRTYYGHVPYKRDKITDRDHRWWKREDTKLGRDAGRAPFDDKRKAA